MENTSTCDILESALRGAALRGDAPLDARRLASVASALEPGSPLRVQFEQVFPRLGEQLENLRALFPDANLAAVFASLVTASLGDRRAKAGSAAMSPLDEPGAFPLKVLLVEVLIFLSRSKSCADLLSSFGCSREVLLGKALNTVLADLDGFLPGLRHQFRSINRRFADTADGISEFAARALQTTREFKGVTWSELRARLWATAGLVQLEIIRKAVRHRMLHASQDTAFQLQAPIVDEGGDPAVAMPDIQVAIQGVFDEDTAHKLATAITWMREDDRLTLEKVAGACGWSLRRLRDYLKELATALGFALDLAEDSPPDDAFHQQCI